MIVSETKAQIKHSKIIEEQIKLEDDQNDENTYYLAKTYCEEELINSTSIILDRYRFSFELIISNRLRLTNYVIKFYDFFNNWSGNLQINYFLILVKRYIFFQIASILCFRATQSILGNIYVICKYKKDKIYF